MWQPWNEVANFEWTGCTCSGYLHGQIEILLHSVQNHKILTKVTKLVQSPINSREYTSVSLSVRGVYYATAKNCAAAMELLQPKIMLPPYHLQLNFLLLYTRLYYMGTNNWRTKPITLGAILCQVLTQIISDRSCSGLLAPDLDF